MARTSAVADKFKSIALCLLILVAHVRASPPDGSNSISDINERPIIGILAQESPPELSHVSPGSISYIAASYVKFIESAGARAVPIRINQPESYYTEMFSSINGLLIPGGGASLEASGYAKAGALLYDLAIESNEHGDYFPVWGTCLGFELLTYLSAGKRNVLTSCSSYDRALNLNFLQGAENSRLLRALPQDIYDVLATEESTSNFHHWCLTPDNATLSGLDRFYQVLATSSDDSGLTFVSSIEARDYPIWGVQFHPEKNIFEWSSKYRSIPHSAGAIKAAQYFAEFFVSRARQNTHAFSSSDAEERSLIYNFHPLYTGNVSGSFVQCYFFD